LTINEGVTIQSRGSGEFGWDVMDFAGVPSLAIPGWQL
jgi:hypothetical protein